MNASAQRWFQQNGLTAMIVLLALGALAAIGLETRWGTSISPAPDVLVGKVNKSDDTSLLPAFALPEIDAGFKETVERPLFLPTRRPVPIVTAAALPMMTKGKYRLAGTVVNQEVPVAFLVEIATGKSMRVVMGAEILGSGISVASIDLARVVLKQGDETEELTLRTASSPPPQAAAPSTPGSVVPVPAQRPPPQGVVVSGVPTFNAPGPVPRQIPPVGAIPPINPTVVQPGSSALPGFVQSPPPPEVGSGPPTLIPGQVPSETLPPGAVPPSNQSRRRFQNAPPR